MRFIFITFFIFISLSCSTSSLITTHSGRSTKTVQKKELRPSTIKTTLTPQSNTSLTEKKSAVNKDVSVEQVVQPNFSAKSDEKESASFFSFFGATQDKKEKLRSTESFATNSNKIGVLLPLTGKNSHVGQLVLNTIREGFGVQEKSGAFSIVLYDTQGSSELAALGVEKLLKEDGVIALLGGLSAKEAQAISEKADFFQIPFFTFSQKSGLTEGSEFTFRNAVTAEMQVNALVSFAITKLAAKRFALLFPNDAYGVEFANQFWDAVLSRGGEIAAAQVYDPKETDFSSHIQKTVGTYYIEDRLEEYREKQAELEEKKKRLQADNKNKKNLRESDAKENILSPIIDFDVLFIPDSGRALGQAMAFMKSSDVATMTYMGTNLWNTPDIFRRAGPISDSSGNQIYFVDSSAAHEKTTPSAFYTKSVDANGQPPTILEIQTYEAAKILHDLILSGATSRDRLADQLRTLGRTRGAVHELLMNNNQELERPLSILKLDHGQIVPQELN